MQQQFRSLFTQKNLAMIGVPIATASFCFWASRRIPSGPSESAIQTRKSLPASNGFLSSARDENHGKAATATATSLDAVVDVDVDVDADADVDTGVRLFQTPADKFFRENKKIPPPLVPHATLEELSPPRSEENRGKSNESVESGIKNKNGILVIGDVHGCYDELMELHAKAVAESNAKDFSHVVLVGDLCNKGPESAKVIRHTRVTPGWFSVRGNHDDGALAAALGDERRMQSKTYQWVVETECCDNETSEEKSDESVGIDTGSGKSSALSDDDVQWLSQLPYTILIPGEYFGEDEDTLVVHAGLIPDNELDQQKPRTMTTIRDLVARCGEEGTFSHYEYYSGKDGEPVKELDAKSAAADDERAAVSCDEAVAWASAWKGPQKVIFGHDARRKLQLYDWATGLDTGAVYGGELTGIILPARKLVSVKSKEYSPIT